MLRTILGAVCLFAIAGFVMAEEKKATVSYGKFKSIKDGTVTITVTKKGEDAKDVNYKVADDVKTTLYTGEEKKELAAKDAFKDVKEGTIVILTLDGDKVTAVQIGVAKKK